MKIITAHHDGLGLNDRIRIEAQDEDVNGVPHRFIFSIEAGGLDINAGLVQFQKGPRHEDGSTPGITTETLLVVLIEMLRGFQDGPYGSREGALTLTKLEEALLWSRVRATERAGRGVLGHNKA